jgi:DTW domain-containing protein
VLILQHPNERHKYYSTAKLVTRALSNARILKGVEFDSQHLARAVQGQHPYLLYPGSESADCKEVSLDARSTIIVVDGTWSEAGKIVYRNPLLKSFPRVSFAEVIESKYRIRKQPKQGCLSTLESLAHLLIRNAVAQGKLEYVERYEEMLRVFSKMVDQQISFFPRMKSVSATVATDATKYPPSP